MYKNQFGYQNKRMRKWTKTAIECYTIGCDCSKCEINNLITNKCLMKYTVLELVKTIGAPQIKRNDIL